MTGNKKGILSTREKDKIMEDKKEEKYVLQSNGRRNSWN